MTKIDELQKWAKDTEPTFEEQIVGRWSNDHSTE